MIRAKGWLRAAARGQVSIEFTTLLSILLIIIIITMSYLSDTLSDITSSREYDLLDDLGYGIQGELIIAKRVNDGYLREFTIPESYFGYDFTIKQLDRLLILTSGRTNVSHQYFIPHVNGTLMKGVNLIHKSGGEIYLNS